MFLKFITTYTHNYICNNFNYINRCSFFKGDIKITAITKVATYALAIAVIFISFV